MTRGNARELAVHLIYSREFTGQEPEREVAVRLDKEYYPSLSQENAVYADRPSAAQLRYIDSVVSGVANRENELNEQIRKFSIGWDISRISRLTRCVLQLAIYEILLWRMCQPVSPSRRLSVWRRCTTEKRPVPSPTAFWVPSPGASPRRRSEHGDYWH